MRYFIIFILTAILISVNTQSTNGQSKSEKTKKAVMKRFVVERDFPNGLEIPINEKGCKIVEGVVSNNSEENVTWVRSFVSADKKKSFCIYDGPSEEAIRNAAKKNNIPISSITEVTVLDPYFYK